VDEIESAGLGGEDVGAVQLAENERPKAERIADADDFALAHDDEAERALEAPQHTQGAAAVLRRLSQEMRNDFAIGRGLENGAFAFQLIAENSGVDQVAVVRHRDLAAKTIDHERLRVFQRARPGSGVAGVPERPIAL
jgi:hypothetical protein